MQKTTANGELQCDSTTRPSLYTQHSMKESIKTFTNSQYIELFKIVRKYSTQYTQNANGEIYEKTFGIKTP